MDTETTKLKLMQLLLQTQKKSVLAKIQSVFEEESSDWWHDLNQEEREEIQAGIEQADKGEYVDNDKIKKVFDKCR
jgi:predicted transcriptional regulator